ncbi:MAG: Membrane protein insertase, YidC/Oxa1 family [Candidatus Magasanikbacteria bacterium GW2011_GWA2_56_11]|uniref:Membrane protein insertase, YidC/Oxa1 family n=1 Tax=Candidatus Magasanikbacteria bacterium GW2011_GWA2_56_11 TaxID=1619044 RepID=A0A0G2B7U5_9BACT|nr:MAG: Membrane protein insertase, YidC/Oxa1 family [Candidatus Magasanikbacteria bacterium GW2011_GWA2_56_11]
MREIFQIVVYQPIFNAFVGLYDLIPDVGMVILLLTVIIKAVLYPLTSSSIRAQKSLSELQPKLEELKQKHKGNQQVLAQETMKLYKEHKVNPFGSCLPLLVQLPIFLALYWVLQRGLTTVNFDGLYPFVPNPGNINTVTLGLVDLKQTNLILAVLAGLAQYWQAKMLTRKKPPLAAGTAAKDETMAAIMNKQMLYLMPAMTVLIGAQLPGGLALYWLFSTALTALQQLVLFRQGRPDDKSGILEGKIE